MRIDLAPFVRGGQSSLAFSVCGDLAGAFAQEACTLRGPVCATGRLTYLGGGEYLAEGELAAELGFACARCLKSVWHCMRLPFSERFAKTGDDGERYAYSGDSMDLSRMAAEQMLMQMPMRVLCREGCRGLCGVCGADLNETDCACVPQAPGAFAGLEGRGDDKED